MQRPRFIFLSASAGDRLSRDPVLEKVLWMLVSPNNRQLGRGAIGYGSYGECRAAVQRLRAGCTEVQRLVTGTPGGGQWTWRLQLAGAAVAVSSRSYLRLRECHYNLDRFLESVPVADLVDGVRVARGDRPAVAAAGEVRGAQR